MSLSLSSMDFRSPRRMVAAVSLAALSALSALSGCATGPAGAMLTYESVPLGATLFEGAQALGTAPLTRTYAVDPKTGEVRTPDVTAVWPSGAKTTFWTVLKVGDDRVASMQRPANAPGLAADQANAQKFASDAANDAARQKEAQRSAMARASARCQAQQAGGAPTVIDDCK